MTSRRESSYEYNPIQTEMNNDITSSSIRDNRNQLSDLQSDSENILDESSELNSNRLLNDVNNLNNLQSLRISHSISEKKNEYGFFEKERNFKESSDSIESDIVLQTPPKQSNKIQIMKNVFDCESTDNKNLIVSELDIQISSSAKKEANIPKTNKISNRNVNLNLKEIFDKNLKKRTSNKNNDKIINKNVSYENQFKQHILLNHKPEERKDTIIRDAKILLNSKRPNSHVKSAKELPKNNSTCKQQKKQKSIYSSVKKMNTKVSIFDLLKKVSNKSIRSSSLKKMNTSSNRSSSVKKDSASTKYSTIESKKKSLIPPTHLKKPNYISSFKYYQTENSSRLTKTKRPNSLAKKNIKINTTDFNNNSYSKNKPIKTSSSSKGKYFNKYKYNFNQSILTTLGSNNFSTISHRASSKKSSNNLNSKTPYHQKESLHLYKNNIKNIIITPVSTGKTKPLGKRNGKEKVSDKFSYVSHHTQI